MIVKQFQKFLVDNGLIFEINRKVLHPLGFAMVVDIDPKNRKNLAITALEETEDPEGFLYDPEGFEIGSDKYNRYLNKRGGQERLDARNAKYGFIEQDKQDVE
jgi:hypothetical protein